MMKEIGTDFLLLKQVVDRISQIYFETYGSEVGKARALPDIRAGAAKSLEIRGAGFRDDTKETIAAAVRLRERLVETERAAGERERDRRLADLAVEADALRGSLSALVGAAVIDVGRAIRETLANPEGKK